MPRATACWMLVAKKLCAAVRQTDTVARMGGDEFVIVMPEFRDQKDAERCAEAILQKVATPTMLGNREVNVTVSVGLCIFPDCARDADSLLKNADAAMYEAKESGRNTFHVFNQGMVVATADKLEFEHDLRHALINGELSLHYQPQVSCITGEVIGVEALLRWTTRGAASIPPAQFIPLAEATGLIVPIGEWAIRTACHEGKELQDSLGRELVIAVNLSPRQFRQKNLAALVETALRESGLPARSLEIEITEQTLMTNSRDHQRDADAAAQAGREDRDRRLRDRLLQLLLPAAVRGGPAEDRPQLCEPVGGRPERGGDCARDHLHGAWAEPEGGGRGRGDERPAELPAAPALRRGAGLLLRPSRCRWG